VSEPIRIIVTPVGQDLWDARLAGHVGVLCRSRTPFLTAARLLAARALHDSEVMVQMHHVGCEDWALRGRLADVARLAVVERRDGRAKFEKWQPIADSALEG
jgi:hypothetical protein